MERTRTIVFYNNGLGKGGAHHSHLAWIDLLRRQPHLRLVHFCHKEGWFTEQLALRGLPYEILPMPSALAKIRHGQWKNRLRTVTNMVTMVWRLGLAWTRVAFVSTDAVVLTGGRDFIMLLPLVLRKRAHTTTVPQTTDWGEIPTCRTMCRLAAKTFAISDEVAATIVAMDVPAERVSVLPLIFTVDNRSRYADRFRVRSELKVQRSGFVLGMAGVVRPHKGQMEAVRVLHHLLSEGHDVHLILVGAPPPDAADAVDYDAKVRAEVDKLGIQDRVVFAGWQSDVSKWMRTFDVLLVPSHDFEGVPRVILEGLEAGLPIVGTDLPQFVGILQRYGVGKLHRVTATEAWAQSIREWMSDPDLCRNEARRARWVWEQHYSEHAAEKHLLPAFQALTQ